MKCRKCGADMKQGVALYNVPWVHADFPGDYEGPLLSAPKEFIKRGQTISSTGEAIEVQVMKCSGCGHSVMP